MANYDVPTQSELAWRESWDNPAWAPSVAVPFSQTADGLRGAIEAFGPEGAFYNYSGPPLVRAAVAVAPRIEDANPPPRWQEWAWVGAGAVALLLGAVAFRRR